MRSFTFKWPHDAEEVYVTGTFDDWTKSERLERVGEVFQKTVTLPDSADKVLYKFVVDGSWTTDHTAPQEKDKEGNDNNVLLPEQMDNLEEASQAAAINNLVPESTTAQLAGAVPLESNKEEEKQEDKKDEGQAAASDAAILSSAAPDSTTAQLAAAVPLEEKKKENGTLPGEFPKTPATDLEKEVKVDPLPAAEGAINPVKLEPGESVPKDVTASTIDSHVTLDKESYEKSDRIPGVETTLPAATGDMIPESSLPITTADVATISTVTPESTTAKLAGDAPLEPKVPEIVKKSQEEAKVEPEASANSEEVKEKAVVEGELLDKVDTAPSTSEGTAGEGTEKSETEKTSAENVVDAATTVGEVALGAAITAAGVAIPVAANAASKASGVASEVAHKAGDAAADVASKATAAASDAATNGAAAIKGSLPGAAAQAQAEEEQKADIDSISPEVPAEVKESLKEAGESPEAAVNAVAVEEKKNLESELLDKVKPVDANDTVSPEVPTEVKESLEKAGESPEAAANAAAVDDKKEYEAELLEKVEPEKAIDESSTKVAEEPTATQTGAEDSLSKPTEEAAPAEEATALAVEPPQPVEAVKTVDEPAPAETSKPVEEANTSDVKLTDEIAPAVSAMAVEPPKPAETVKAVDVAEPAETTKIADEPKTAAEAAVVSEPANDVDTPKPVGVPATTEELATTEPAKPAPETSAGTESAAPTETTEATKKADEEHPATNGSTTAAPDSKAAEVTGDKAASDKKKKHRISGFFSKLKQKFA
ncbi:hypothetical protein C7999DRAFT_29774 [Corynascus novoguineensis]|uniref:AMP-activated protein kinase glycogen-binding domain-containing protein n=1 Tax=Corynascus novoguineensis TaxID=1126955 RepID=A0AAN7CXI9_9PEZI|nr:hypothetical protein C7999DRAFT_29774 [Corynascus novoguineensis]